MFPLQEQVICGHLVSDESSLDQTSWPLSALGIIAATSLQSVEGAVRS